MCRIIRKPQFRGKISYYTFFNTSLDLKSGIPFMAYVLEESPNTVNMMQLNSERSFDPVNVGSQFDITDIDANQRYIFVTVRDAKRVYVLKNDLS